MTDFEKNIHRELFQRGQEQILEQLYRNSTLTEICDTIVHLVESTGDDLMCSILEYNSETETLHRLAAPNLPEFFNNAIDGMKAGPGIGACGAAAYINNRVVTEDLLTHPFWKRARNLVKKTDLRSCWSQPILGYDGNVLGTFAIYHNEPQGPSSTEIEIIESAAHLAAIAIAHKKAEEKRKQIEEHLQQTKKMEAVGSLAEGIAHDFNSILSTISEDLATIQANKESKNDLSHHIEKINATISQAKELTSQILEFSSQDSAVSLEINLTAIIDDTIDMLKSNIPSSIEVIAKYSKSKIYINANSERIQKALSYLCRNAVESIRGHGEIRIHLKEAEAANIPFLDTEIITNKRYAKIVISDTGTGIKASVIDRIFEPFFTTKEVGIQTGMGLSVVHGIVKQNGGIITVKSKSGAGSTFSLFFPVVERN